MIYVPDEREETSIVLPEYSSVVVKPSQKVIHYNIYSLHFFSNLTVILFLQDLDNLNKRTVKIPVARASSSTPQYSHSPGYPSSVGNKSVRLRVHVPILLSPLKNRKWISWFNRPDIVGLVEPSTTEPRSSKVASKLDYLTFSGYQSNSCS
jgi:hypothetical protein